MPDNYMPDVVVEIAFNAGYTTPAASRTWTDVSTYVELAERISIVFGRQDERSTADANVLTLTLDNSDGRFTAGRSASPYYPNVKIGRPIRVKTTPPGGTTSTRFVGFIDEWPVEWDGSDRYAKTTIRATSRLARVGLSTSLRSVLEEEILQAKPGLYYTLGDPAGSSQAADLSPDGVPALVTRGQGSAPQAVVFGTATGPGTDDLTAATFTATEAPPGSWSSGDYLSLGARPTITVQTVSAFVLVSALTSGATVLQLNFQLSVRSDGKVSMGVPGNELVGASSIADGLTHHVAALWNNSTGARAIYVDGVLYASDTTTPPAVTTFAGGGFMGLTLSGVLAHVAAFPTVLSATKIADIHAAGVDAFEGERTDQRLIRVLSWAGVASTEITTETGVETMTYQKTVGQSVIDTLRDVEATEGGVLFDGRDGNVTFHNRSHRYLAAAAATLNMASQHVGADYQPKLDRSALINTAAVANPTTGETAQVVNTASRDEYGPVTVSLRSVADTVDALHQKAAWLIASYAEPRVRVASLTVDVLAHQGLTPSAQTLLGLTVGDLLAVSNAPSQADTTSPSYFVEGYAEVIGSESYEITFNLSPTGSTLNTFVLDSATRGVLDTNILAL